MSRIIIFDRALCCSTGVCGPQVDPALPRFAADLEWLKHQGHQVDRFNLAQDAQHFAADSVVQKMLTDHGVECLPLVFVDQQLVSQCTYPSREDLAQWTRTKLSADMLPIVDQGCCGDTDCC